jgi:hypothetical protein
LADASFYRHTILGDGNFRVGPDDLTETTEKIDGDDPKNPLRGTCWVSPPAWQTPVGGDVDGLEKGVLITSPDRYGRGARTKESLARWDLLVQTFCRVHRLPAAVSMAGGYGRYIADTVEIHEIHVETVRVFRKRALRG